MTKTTVTYKDYRKATVTYDAKNLRDALLKLPDHLYMGEIPHVENIINIKGGAEQVLMDIYNELERLPN